MSVFTEALGLVEVDSSIILNLSGSNQFMPCPMLLNCGAGEYLRVPWRARRSNHSILKEINSEYSLEGLTLKLKL